MLVQEIVFFNNSHESLFILWLKFIDYFWTARYVSKYIENFVEMLLQCRKSYGRNVDGNTHFTIVLPVHQIIKTMGSDACGKNTFTEIGATKNT